MKTLRTLNLLAVITGGAPVPGTPGQLYNLEADPGEQTNLWDKHKDIVTSLTTLLERYQEVGRSVPVRK